MKTKILRHRNALLLALPAAIWLSGTQGIHAQAPTTNRYWDPNGGGSFGAINNTTTWVSPLNIVWTNSSNGGTSRLSNYTTTLTDICNFGGPLPPATPTNFLGGGTVPVGTVNAGWLSFNQINGTNTVTLSGGTITLNAVAKIIANTASQFHTISSTLAGAATSLTKDGPGTIVLSGSNIFSGPTIVTAGTLTLGSNNALANSPLDTTASVVGSATAGLKATVAALTFGGLSGSQDLASVFTTTSGGFGAVTSLTLNPGNAVTATYTGVIADGAVGMALTKTGSGTQVLAGANTYTGSTTVNAGVLRLDYGTQDNSKLSDAALVLGSGTIELSGGTHPEVVASTTLNGNATVTRSSGAVVLSLGAISGPGTIDFSAGNIATTTNPNDLTGILPFATIGGNLAANDGSGNIVSYTGYVDIDARGPSTVPDTASANVRILGDGTAGNIDLAATTTTINTLSQGNANFAATIDTALKTFGTNSISLGASAESLNLGVAAGDGSLRSPNSGGALALTNLNPAKLLTINAAIVDNTSASSLNTGGAGSVVLAGPNTHTGPTTVGDGTLVLSGSLTDSSISVVGDAVLDQTASGMIAGNITIAHDGTGASKLAGANTYSGITSINTGSVNIQNDTALGDTTAGTTVASGAALLLENNITTGGEALSLTGTGIGGTGALRNISGANTYGGPVTLTGATLITSDGGTLTLSDPGSLTGATFTLSVGGAGNTIINSIIDTTTGSLAKVGAGTLTLTGANNFTGAVNITGGVVNIQNNLALGTIAGGVVVGTGSALELQGAITVGNEPLTLVGTGVSNNGALRNISGDNTWGGAITLSVATRFQSDAGTLRIGSTIAGTGPGTGAPANPPMTFGGDGNITVAGSISAGTTGNGTLTKQGAGTLTFQAANTYTGATVISAGILSLENASGLQNSPLDTTASVLGDATNGLKTTGTTLPLGGITGNKNLADVFTTTSGGFGSVTGVTLNTPITTGVVLTYSYAGTIADGATGMTLTKSGAGVQTFTGVHSYTGATTITGGTLKLDGAASIATSPSITLGSATGLDVSTLTTPLSLGSGQTLRSSATGANATGTLTTALAEDLTLSAGGLVFSAYGGANGISATNAPLTVTGATAGELKLNGAPVTVTTTSLLATGTYVLVAKGGSALVTGTPGPLTVNGAGVNGNPSLAVIGDQLVLNVVAGGFTSWQSVNGTAGGIDQDHDFDGVDNGTEYFLVGPNGNSTGFTAVPSVVPDMGGLSITWIKGAGYIGIYNTDFVVETSTTLSGAWTVEASPGNVVDSPTEVKYTFPAPITGASFARLKVTGP